MYRMGMLALLSDRTDLDISRCVSIAFEDSKIDRAQLRLPRSRSRPRGSRGRRHYASRWDLR